MKYLFLQFLFLGASLFCLTNCSPNQGYKLEGELQGVEDGSKITLTLSCTHREEKTELETTLQNGRFSFQGELPEPRLYYLGIEEPSGNRGGFTLMLENNNIRVNASKTASQNPQYLHFKDIEIKGSEAHQTYMSKMAFRDTLDQMHHEIQIRYQQITQQLKSIQEAENKNLFDSLNSCLLEVEKDMHDFFTHTGKKIYEEVEKNGDSFWGPLILLNNKSYFIPGDTLEQAVFNRFSEEAQNSFYGKALNEQLFGKSLLNKPLPAFSLPNDKEDETEIANLIKGKKCVLIDFWASWCGPCRKSIPTLKQIYQEYATAGFEIISISIDKDKAAWDKALKEEQLPWPNLLDTLGIFKSQFHGRAIPTFFLVDEQGKVIGENLEVGKLKEVIQKQLAQ